jgi:hypothetical protein
MQKVRLILLIRSAFVRRAERKLTSNEEEKKEMGVGLLTK